MVISGMGSCTVSLSGKMLYTGWTLVFPSALCSDIGMMFFALLAKVFCKGVICIYLPFTFVSFNLGCPYIFSIQMFHSFLPQEFVTYKGVVIYARGRGGRILSGGLPILYLTFNG